MMGRVGFLVLGLGVFAGAAFAQELPADFCSRLVAHEPDADVAYQPGIDVNGNAVVPADLPGNGGPLSNLDGMTIPLTLPLAKSIGIKNQDFPFSVLKKTDINLGVLTLSNGHVMLNGKPLSDPEQDRLRVLCLKPR